MAGLMSGMLVRGSDVCPLTVDWAWEGLVPVGAVTMVTGEPGIGKSLVAMHVAARVTRGIRMSPVTPEAGSSAESAEDETEPMGVIVLSSVDRHDDTVLPRLIAAGADPSLVFFLKRKIWKAPVKGRKDSGGLEGPVSRSFRLSQDLEDLQECVEELFSQGISIGLIVIDSIHHYIGPNEKKSDRIQVVAALDELAENTLTSVLVTANTSMKAGSRGGTVVYQELMNTSRSVLMVVRDLDDEDRRLVLPLKHNLIARPAGAAFSLKEPGVQWEAERITISAQSYLNQARMREKNPLIHQEIDELSRAARWLRDELASGHLLADDIQEQAKGVHISNATLRRAFKAIEAKTTKIGHRWFWSLGNVLVPAADETSHEVGGVVDEDLSETRAEAKQGRKEPDECLKVKSRCANVSEPEFELVSVRAAS